MSGWFDPRRPWLLAVAAAAMVALSLGAEIYQDDEPVTAASLALEFFQVAFSVGGAIASTLLLLRVRAQEQEGHLLRRELQVIRAESQRWREEMGEHLRELGAAIRRQFAAWRLTAAEQEVGLLLLKGLSHKEIARVRRTGEATIRQQAASLYQKAGLGGRAALSAFFLDDLLAEPAPDAAPSFATRRDDPGRDQPRGVASSVTSSRPARS